MKKCFLLLAGFAFLCNSSGWCQEGWRLTAFIAPGLTKVYQWDDKIIGGMAGIQYGLHRGRLIASAGANFSYLRSATDFQPFSGRQRATQPFVEFPIGVGIATRPKGAFHFELKADVGYLTSLNMTSDFMTVSPSAAFIWSGKGKGSGGIILKAMQSINPVEGYQPSFFGIGAVYNSY